MQGSTQFNDSGIEKVIQKWEASGQGDGEMFDCHDDPISEEVCNNVTHLTTEFGGLENCSQVVLCNCCSFVRFNESYLLHLWKMLKRYDLHCTSLQMLYPKISAIYRAEDYHQYLIMKRKMIASLVCQRNP